MVGQETLNRISHMVKFNQWMFEIIEPGIGNKIIEVGCGIGNITEFLLTEKTQVIATDISDNYLDSVNNKFRENQNFQTEKWDISQPPSDMLREFKADTVVCLNVLEHVGNDIDALKNINSTLTPNGRLMLLVPAYQWLYGTLDKELEHYKRYVYKDLKRILEVSGFEVEKHLYMNLAGIPGWWLSGKILKRKILPNNLLTIYHKMVSFFKLVEKITGQRVGLSIIAFARKKEI